MAFTFVLEDDTNTMKTHDPIYGDIEIKSPFKEIILTKEMQRLNNITQNGFSNFDYPGLENNERLSHSVGAFYIMSQIIEHLEKELKRYDIFISKDDKDMALCSMLLHDIGHGPFSHNFESITHYSHEKRTTDILLGDTEINHLLTSIYGQAKLKRIASYIAEINDYGNDEKSKTSSSFTKLLKSLISHQLDADRLDYLVRDSYHAGLPTAINYKNLIQSLGVSINNNKEYELLVDKKGLTSIETILIERFQRYRDVYYTKSDTILVSVFSEILERYKSVPNTVNVKLPKSFSILAFDPQNISLNDFLEMNDKQFLDAFEIIKNNCTDPILRYMADIPQVLADFEELENNIQPELLKQKLTEIFPSHNFSNTFSIVRKHSKIKLYKAEESLRVNLGRVHKDLSVATPHLIRPDEFLERDENYFNPELVRIELDMSEMEFEPYKERIRNMINELDKKPEEFELKYIIDKDGRYTQNSILQALLTNGFDIVSTKEKENDDEYFDTKELSLLSRGGSLRIRKLTQDGKPRYKATYKMPTTIGEVYSSREEVEIDLDENSIDDLKNKMKNKNLDENLDAILPMPILNAVTQRKDIVLEKNGVQVCLSFDNTQYKNHVFKGQQPVSSDSMIEIEALGNITDRVILNEINDLLHSNFPDLQINKQSKYERGTRKTREEYAKSKKTRIQGVVVANETLNDNSEGLTELDEEDVTLWINYWK